MSDFDLDHELRRALRATSEPASPGFTRRVLARLEDEPTRRRRLPRPAFAAAAALLFIVVGVTGLVVSLQSRPAAVATRRSESSQRQELLREYRALERELDQLRQLADEQDPVLYLGGDEDFDLMYDLAGYRADRPQDGPRPASLPDRG